MARQRRKVERIDYRDALVRIRDMIRDETDENFRQSREPDGKPWPWLSWFTLEHRKESAEGDEYMLIDTGNLFRRAVVFPVVLMTRNRLVYRVPVSYAAKHQHGGQSKSGHEVPRRRFLGWNDRMIAEAKRHVAKVAAAALSGKARVA